MLRGRAGNDNKALSGRAASWSVDVRLDAAGRIASTEASGEVPAWSRGLAGPRANVDEVLERLDAGLASGVRRALSEAYSLQGTRVVRAPDGRGEVSYEFRPPAPDAPAMLRLQSAPRGQVHAEALQAEGATAAASILGLLNRGWAPSEAARAVLPLVAARLGFDSAALFGLRGIRGSLLSACGPTRKRGFPYPMLDAGDPFLAGILSRAGMRVLTGKQARSRLQPALRAVSCGRPNCMVLQSIFAGHELSGLLVLSGRRTAALSVDEAELLSVTGDALGLSLGSAALRVTTQASEVLLETAAATAQSIAGSLDLNETFARIAHSAAQLTGNSHCLLLELEAGSSDLVAVASSSEADDALIGTRVRFDDADAGGPLVSSRRFVVEDTVWGARLSAEQREKITLRSALIVPIRSEQLNIGALLLYSAGRREDFSDEDVARAESIAEQAASAICNARLYRSLQRSELQSRRLLERIASLRGEQRLAFANMIHDEIVQTIVAALYELEGLPEDLDGAGAEAVERVTALLRGTIREARTMIRELRPPALDGLGLSGALKALVESSAKDGDLQVDLTCEDVDDLHPDLRSAMYTVAREALHNARRHAAARHVVVDLGLEVTASSEGSSKVARLEVVDDGTGFDPDQAMREDHFGLKIMDEQVAWVGGTLRIRSTPGEGTHVVATLPVSARSAQEDEHA